MKYLVDSVILIDHFNGIDQATSWIAGRYSELPHAPAISRRLNLVEAALFRIAQSEQRDIVRPTEFESGPPLFRQSFDGPRAFDVG